MHAGSDRPEREVERAPAARRPGHPRPDDGEPDNARRVTFTIAIVVTSVFLLLTAGGIGWFIAGGLPSSGEGTAADTGADDGTGADDTAETDAAPADRGGEGTVSDSHSGLAYDMPGDGWTRLGDDQVPAGYSSYVVYGSADDPDAIIVTGTEDLGPLEPIAVSGVRLAADMVGDLITGGGDVRVEPSGQTSLDGLPAFGATMGSDTADGEGGYGRFLVVELNDDTGAFMLGLNTGGGAEATAGIDAAFESVGTLQ
ncbi:hypothetical protein [Nocardiopsis metallicus]|uniref:Uncharacterized protein n=1 Tax=Nocardiopsis metallicus TaxID=179819 RepID=A0A840WBH8_9ACTN|nr:hypothetical protein [Nocardiopsis metallicus]MBB5493492.1 hypothetical protein [Nocardiopsis metallicus]